MRHLDQHASPIEMPKAVIDQLESIQVNVEQRKRLALILDLTMCEDSRSERSRRLGRPVSGSLSASCTAAVLGFLQLRLGSGRN